MESENIKKLIDQFKRLPGVGEKTAERFVYYYLRAPKEQGLRTAEYLKELISTSVQCSICHTVSDTNPCKICSSSSRNKDQICVVENPLDIVSIEKTSIYSGVYFVLGGVIDPANGIGPEELLISKFIKELKERYLDNKKIEIIFAFGPSLQSEATISYILSELRENNINSITVSKLAQGLPSGADIQFIDSNTLSKAINSRITINNE